MRFRKPFYRESRKLWYVQLDGKQINLGPDKKDAFEQYKKLINERKLHPIGEEPLVVEMLDLFLEWCQREKAVRTFEWYRRYLQSFIRSIPPDLIVADLRPFHVHDWIAAHPGWVTGKRGAITSVQRALNWAQRQGRIESNPIRYIEKPAQGRREQLVSEEEYREILGLVNDQQFSDLLQLSWETGCRPFELFSVEAAYVDLATARWVFPIRLSKGKKIQRVVYLSDTALAITRRLMLAHPKGPLLLNTEGRPWSVSSVKCRFQKICRELGRRRLRASGEIPKKIPFLNVSLRKDPIARADHEKKVLERRRQVNQLAKDRGTRINLYAIRHSMVTEALVKGLDAVTVSVLAGHRDTTMISRVYAHLTQKHDHMRAAANRVRELSASA